MYSYKTRLRHTFPNVESPSSRRRLQTARRRRAGELPNSPRQVNQASDFTSLTTLFIAFFLLKKGLKSRFEGVKSDPLHVNPRLKIKIRILQVRVWLGQMQENKKFQIR